jgi:hypothetical protein
MPGPVACTTADTALSLASHVEVRGSRKEGAVLPPWGRRIGGPTVVSGSGLDPPAW